MSLQISDLRRGFRLGPWTVLPDRGSLQQNGDDIHLEPMVMDVLLTLVAGQGDVVSKEQLIDSVWAGRNTSDDAIAAKIGVLRNRLGDNSRDPTYIETVQKRGYRLKSTVAVAPLVATDDPGRQPSRRTTALFVVLAIMAAVVAYRLWPADDAIDSIAVVPFVNLSDEVSRFQYMTDGFTEELVVSLGRVPDVRIIRAPPSLQGASPSEVAKQLRVDSVLTGSLRTDGSRLRISVQLVAANGFQRWADSLDGESRELFEFQQLVGIHVRNEVTGNTGTAAKTASRPANQDAGDNYLRGLFFLAKRDLASLKRADTLFEQAIMLDPNFGQAYLRRAITKLLLADYSPDEKQAIYDAALEIARRGAQRDASIRDSIQLIPAFVHQQRGNWSEAHNAFEVALNSDTAYAPVYHWYSRYLGDLGLLKESLQQALIARAIEPAAQVLNSRVAIAYLWIGDRENARIYFDDANRMGVGSPDHFLGYAIFLLRDGRVEEARTAVETAFRLAQRGSTWIDPVFESLASPEDEGLRTAAYEAIDAAQEQLPPYVAMAVWTIFGEVDRAMDIALRSAAAKGFLYELEIVFTKEFAEFRRHEKFLDLLTSLGVVRHWQNLGCQWIDAGLECSGE